MGAHEFQTYQAGSDMRAAYQEASGQSAYERGHDGYSGTIATTYGVRQVVRQPMTHDGATFYAGQIDPDTLEKWGDAHAIPVAADQRFTFTTKKISIELPVRKPVTDWDGKDTGQTAETTQWDLHDAARAEAQKLFGNTVHTVEVTTKLKAKAVSEPTPGTSVIRYEVSGTYGPQKLYTTKAQAVKGAGERLLASNDFPKLSVKQVRYWPEADSTDAVTVRKVTVSAKADAVVTIATPRAGVTPEGWLFYGLAGS